jgi:hypothetical protein
MAEVTETIGTGQDRVTVTLWEANVGVFGTDFYHGVISTNDAFVEEVTLTGSTGTPSITSYLWLDVDPANRHAGVEGTGHGRMSFGNPTPAVLTCDAPFTRVSWLEIELTGTASSDEGIRVNAGCDDTLLQYLIVHGARSGGAQDGIYTGDIDIARLRIDDCIIYGWDRAGIHGQQFGAFSQTATYFIDHCSIWNCGDSGENESGAIKSRSEDNADDITFTMFNTWGAGTTLNAPFVDGTSSAQPDSPAGTVTWNGSDNGVDDTTDHIQGTDNRTAQEDATDGIVAVTKATGSWIVVTDLSSTTDLTLLDDEPGNIMAGRGVDRQGSEPDARQDFSVAIDGPRPITNVDIGASQVSLAAGASDGAIIIQNAA